MIPSQVFPRLPTTAGTTWSDSLGEGAGPSLLVNGHIDVVPQSQPERWASPPFEPRRTPVR